MLNLVFKCQCSFLNTYTPQGLTTASPTTLFREAVHLYCMEGCVICLLPSACLVASLL